MVSQTQMRCGFVVGFAMCLVGFTAGECDPEHCGSENVSYPFWINKPECGFSGFHVTCIIDSSTGQMARFIQASMGHNRKILTQYYYKIIDVNYTGHLSINSSQIYAQSCRKDQFQRMVFQLPPEGPFSISAHNRLVTLGCHTQGSYVYLDEFPVEKVNSICVSSCYSQKEPPYCLYGCCDISLRDNYKRISFTGRGNFSFVRGVKNVPKDSCGFSTVLDPSTFTIVEKNNTRLFWGDAIQPYYGLRLNWGIGDNNCSTAKGTANYSCSLNADCIDSPSERGHVCKCVPGYEGNGYSNGTGCRDVDECSNSTFNECVKKPNGGSCHNLKGTYNCSCAKGYFGDGFQNRIGCVPKNSNKSILAAILGSVCSFVGASVVACVLIWLLTRHQWKKLRTWAEKEIINSNRGENFKEMSEVDLQRASQSYSTILGKGSLGRVYAGTLPSPDGRQVAIKKVKSISKELINEIIILSHTSHRNVVELIGFCMKVESPLLYLVCEIPSTETLFHHLRSNNSQLKWERRLNIAIGSAEAVVYMHDEAPQSNFHRHIKSSNILLDTILTPRIADFTIYSHNETGSTNHQPPTTPDPEFKAGHHFAHKSNVYSFGVVLVELLTGTKKSLEEFLDASKEKQLIEILDCKEEGDNTIAQMMAMARLAERCLQEEGMSRPSMREVVEDLAWIKEGVTSNQTTHNPYRGRGPDESASPDNNNYQSAAVIASQSSHSG